MANSLNSSVTSQVESLIDISDVRLIESGNRIDRLMTVEIRPIKEGLPCGIVVPMYEVCRKWQGDIPLSLLAAASLKSRIKKGSTVFILTGAGVAPKLPEGETDGPHGAVALAASLIKGFGARVILVTENAHMRPVRAAVELIHIKLNEWVNRKHGREFQKIEVVEFPVGLAAGRVCAEKITNQYQPEAVIAIERDGPNAEGQFHGVRGDCRDPEKVGYVYLLIEQAKMRSALTIGIGDGGNEIGFGKMRDEITALLPNRGRSQEGHPSGVVTVVETDVTVSASVSNWGGFAISAALAVLLNDQDLLHDAQTECELTAVTVSAGARDGATGTAVLSTDGISMKAHSALIELMKEAVKVVVTK